MYLHRYLRLTPVLAILILLVVSFFRHIRSGPYSTVDYNNNAIPCTKYWWSALLHIQNYVNPQEVVSLISFEVNFLIIPLIFSVFGTLGIYQ